MFVTTRTVLATALCLVTCPVVAEEEPGADRIIAALLTESDRDLAQEPACAPFGIGGYVEGKPWLLAQDIAFHLAELRHGENTVQAECWPVVDGIRSCTVSLGQADGEIVWTRNYRFAMAGQSLTGAIMCFTVP